MKDLLSMHADDEAEQPAAPVPGAIVVTIALRLTVAPGQE